jgi:hypothetical protein
MGSCHVQTMVALGEEVRVGEDGIGGENELPSLGHYLTQWTGGVSKYKLSRDSGVSCLYAVSS